MFVLGQNNIINLTFCLYKNIICALSSDFDIFKKEGVMLNKPVGGQKKRFSNYLPHIIIASVLYFVSSIAWLLYQSTPLVFALVLSLAVFLFMSGVIFFLAPALWKMESKSDT